MANREILFRGKRTGNGKWIYGNYNIAEKLDKSGIEYFIIEIEAEGSQYYVLPETVGQYTGLNDKNGEKIFEDDIVEIYDENNDIRMKAYVEFGNPNGQYHWGYQLVPIDKVEVNIDILLWVEMEDTGAFIEVIGNIHDNPELLKGNDEND